MTTACAYENHAAILRTNLFYNISICGKNILVQKQVQYKLYISSTLYDLVRMNTQIKIISFAN